MLKSSARRALLHRRTASSKSHQSIVHPQVSNHGTLTPALRSSESAFRSSHFSSRVLTNAQFYQNPKFRFFASSTSEIHEDPPSESPVEETSEVADEFELSSTGVFDEKTRLNSSESESEGSVSEEGDDNLGVGEGIGENDEASFAEDIELDSTVMEDVSIGRDTENDPVKVENLLSLLQSRGTTDVPLESSLEGMSLELNHDFVLKLLETPHVPGENLIGFFRWALKEMDYKTSTQVLDALVRAICQGNSKKDGYALWDLVNEIGEKDKGVISTESLNALIGLFSKLGKGKAAYDVFNKFEEFECVLNADSYYCTIEALCRRSFFNWACSVCEKMLNADKLPDSARIGKIISYLCKGNRDKDAHLIYTYAKEKKSYPPMSSVSFLIGSLSRIKRADKGTAHDTYKELDRETVSLALEMLADYSAEDRKFAIRPFSSVLKKLCWIEDVDRAKKLLLEMIDAGPPPGNSTFNCVINGLTKSGDMDEAVKIMRVMENRGLKPDVYTYSVVMSGYVRDGAMDEACKIFDEAKKKHTKLSPVTYHTLIRGFCKIEQFDKAVDLLREMKQFGVDPNHDEYNKLIKSLCFKALDWETAEKLREEMKENGVILNGRTSALIGAVKELQEEGEDLEATAAA